MELMRRLALAAPGDGPSLEESLDSIPTGSNVLAAAQLSGDDQGGEAGRAILNRTTRFQRMVVVDLEGFGQPRLPPSTWIRDKLESAGVPVILCQPGGFGQALEALGQVGVSHIATAQAPR